MKAFFIFLICFQVLIFVPKSFAQANEKQDFKLIEQSIEDELYSYAELKLKKFLQNYPQSSFRQQARLWLGQAQYALGRYEQAITTLAPNLEEKSNWYESSLLYSAHAYADSKQWDKAAVAYRKLLSETAQEQMQGEAQLGLAWSLLQQNQERGALQLLQPLIDQESDEELGQLAALVQAKYALSQGKTPKAKALLTTLNKKKLKPRVKYETALWLGELELADKNYASAQRYFSALISDSSVFPKSLVEQALLGAEKCSLQEGKIEEAQTFLERIITTTDNEKNVLAAVKQFLEKAEIANGKNEILLGLRNLVSQNANQSFAAVCLWVIGEAQAKAQLWNEAKITWNELIESFPDTTWRGLALKQLGELEWKQKNLEGAIAKFQQAIREMPNNGLASEAQFRLGEILFLNQRYAEATTNFLAVVENPEATTLKEKAVFNALLALGKQNKITEFDKLKARFSSVFPQSLLQEQTIEEQAQLYARLGQLDRAREQWQLLLKTYPDSLRRAQILLAIGKSFYDEANYQEAINQLSQVTKEFAEGDSFVMAEFLKLCATYQLNSENSDEILSQMKELLKQFPKLPIAGNVQFRIGQIYFDKEDFPNAQTQFESLAKQYPKHEIADESLYFAGLAALRRENWIAAVTLFESLIQQYPNSPRVLEARLGQGHALNAQSKFSEALAIYNSVLQSYGNEAEALLAYIGRGICLFQLAGETADNNRYEEALEAFDKGLKQKNIKIEWRNEAGWRKGKTLEKLGRKEQALEAYLDVIYSRMPLTETNQIVLPEYYWFGKSVVDAGNLLEQKQNWKEVIALYRTAEKQGGPEMATWRDRRLKLQRDYFIYD